MKHKILMSMWCTFIGWGVVLQGIQWFFALSGISWTLVNGLWLAGVLVLVLGWMSFLVHFIVRPARKWLYYKRIEARVNRVEREKVNALRASTKAKLARIDPKRGTKHFGYADHRDTPQYKIAVMREKAMLGDHNAIAWCVANGCADGIPGAITMAALGLDFIQGQ